MAFKKAVKHQRKLKMALAGPSGSGKTYSALAIATELADGQPIAVIDTEHDSASLYEKIFPFDCPDEPMKSYHPDNYIKLIKEAEKAGYAVLVIDSLSHAWNGKGGLLELHEQITRRQKVTNSYTAWADVTPIHNQLIEAITGANIHIIATMRSKTDYVMETNQNGKSVPKKVGLAPIQRDGMEYEFDIFGEMDIDNNLLIQKTRCPELTGAVIAKPGKEIADIISNWLNGEPAPAKVAVQPQAQNKAAPTNNSQQTESADAKQNPPATDRQITSIRKLCTALQRPEPDLDTLTFGDAREKLTELSHAYSEARKAGTVA